MATLDPKISIRFVIYKSTQMHGYQMRSWCNELHRNRQLCNEINLESKRERKIKKKKRLLSASILFREFSKDGCIYRHHVINFRGRSMNALCKGCNHSIASKDGAVIKSYYPTLMLCKSGMIKWLINGKVYRVITYVQMDGSTRTTLTNWENKSTTSSSQHSPSLKFIYPSYNHGCSSIGTTKTSISTSFVIKT